MTAPARAILGFVAAAISVLTFHQAMWWAFHQAGLMPPPYPMNPVPPLGIPQVASLAFWGGLYGAVFGLLMPQMRGPLVAWGLGFGVLAMLVGLFVVAPLKGRAPSLDALGLFRSLCINGFWGIGLGLIAPLLIRRRASRALA